MRAGLQDPCHCWRGAGSEFSKEDPSLGPDESDGLDRPTIFVQAEQVAHEWGGVSSSAKAQLVGWM
jgi:hypothetical protein